MVETAASGGDLTHCRLQAGEREIATRPAFHRARQDETGWVTAMRGRFDSGPSGIAEPDQLCSFVERFAGGIVERCPQTRVAANSGAHEELTMSARDEEQKVREI